MNWGNKISWHPSQLVMFMCYIFCSRSMPVRLALFTMGRSFRLRFIGQRYLWPPAFDPPDLKKLLFCLQRESCHPHPGYGQGKAGIITSYSPACVSLGGGVNTRFHFFVAWFSDGSKSSGRGSELTTSCRLKNQANNPRRLVIFEHDK